MSLPIELSEPLKELSFRAASGSEMYTYEYDIHLVNPNTGYEYKVEWFTNLVIQQDFVSHYTDQIQFTCDIPLTDIFELATNLQDMEVHMVFHPWNDIQIFELDNQDPWFLDGRIQLDENIQLDKILDLGDKGPILANLTEKLIDESAKEGVTIDQLNARLPFTFHILEKDVYDLRHAQVNEIFTDVTMEDVIQKIAFDLGATSVRAITPDNVTKYTNLVIPPMHNIATVYPFLQERYGIYSKGLGYYFTQGTMYLYPLLDLDNSTAMDATVVNILKCPKDYLLGSRTYHNTIDGNLFIVSNTDSNSSNPTTEQQENTGNSKIINKADQTLDVAATIQNGGKLIRNPDPNIVIQNQNTSTSMKQDMQHVQYEGSTSNIFTATSELAAANIQGLGCGWLQALPRIIHPGQNVIYHYDGIGRQYKTRKGRMMGVTYATSLRPSPTTHPYVSFVASLSMIMEPEEQADDTYQTPKPYTD